MTDIDKQDREVMEKLWSLRTRLPGNLDPEIYLLIGMAVGTISRLRDELAKARGMLDARKRVPIGIGSAREYDGNP